MKYSECLVSLFMCLEIGVTWKKHLVFIEVFSVASRGTAELAARVSSHRGRLESWSSTRDLHLFTKKILKSENPKTPWVKTTNPKSLWTFCEAPLAKNPFFFWFPQLDDVFFTRNLPYFLGPWTPNLTGAPTERPAGYLMISDEVLLFSVMKSVKYFEQLSDKRQ